MAIETLTIERVGHRGEGLARVDGEPIFVPLTLAGETVKADVSGNRGILDSILAPSADRIDPFCPHFGVCGGCQLQHMGPDLYGDFKRALVVEALERAGVAAQVGETIFAHGEGRRRASLHATKAKAGYMGLRSREIAGIDRCPILVPALEKAPIIARDCAASVGPCDVSFTASATGLDVAISAKGAEPVARLGGLARHYDLARLSLNGEPVIVDRQPMVEMGKARVPLPIGAFLQATAQAEDTLAGLVAEAVKGHRHVADLFCGMGPFALRLAEQRPVYAADADGPAIDALDRAIRTTQGLKPITAERRDLFREPLGAFELNRFDAVVLDPPRAGAKAQVNELAGSKVKTIAYVSCDPQSFARDAATLVAGGYRIGPVTPVDQFAWSAHTEVFARFEKS